MTKLASALPDGHGLDAVRRALIEEPHRQHVVIGIVGTKAVTTDYEKGSKEPTVGVRKIEAVTITDDLPMVQKLLIRATDKREGKTVLPIEVEDDLADAFKIRSEDIDTDITATGQLDEDQVKALAHSLDRPLRHEVTAAAHVLREHKDWITLGRARRVLELAARRLEENDKRLLRNDDGYLVDPETGEIVDEEKLTSDDLDRMLAALADQHDETTQDTDEQVAECPACEGMGYDPATSDDSPCPRCNGRGTVAGNSAIASHGAGYLGTIRDADDTGDEDEREDE